MKPIIGPHQRTPEWYALRRNADDPRFGATDAAVLLGESRYKTPRHLYEEFIEPPPPMDNDAMRLGRHLEPAVQSLYAEVADMLVIRDVPAALHPTLPVFASVRMPAGETVGAVVPPLLLKTMPATALLPT